MPTPITVKATVVEADNILARYPVPNAKPAEVLIVKSGARVKYIVAEPDATEQDKWLYSRIMESILHSTKPLPTGTVEETKNYIEQFIWEAAEELGLMKQVEKRIERIRYFVTRDTIGYGPLHVPMMDDEIEEISLTGFESPVFIIHRKFQAAHRMETNIAFPSEEELRRYAQRMAVKGGKSLTVARPIQDARLPEGHRVQITYGYEVNLRGTSLSIRKFPKDRPTIAGMVSNKTFSSLMAAYLWLLAEHKRFILMTGATASGKSIPGNEQVLVYSLGRPVLTPIERLYDRVSETRRSRLDGGYEILDCDGIKTAAFDSDLRMRLLPVKSIVRHAGGGEIFRIVTSSGREVRTTGEHSIFSVVDGIVGMQRVSSLSPGVRIAVPRKLPGSGRPCRGINLLKLLAEDDEGLYVENVASYIGKALRILGAARVAELTGLRERDLASNVKRGFAAMRVASFSRMTKAAHIRPDQSGLRIRPKTNRLHLFPPVIPVTAETMRAMGYWVSEGILYDGITLSQVNREIREDMMKSVRRGFGIDAYENPMDGVRLDFNSTVLRALFKKTCSSGNGAGCKRMPKVVFEQGKALLGEFLTGYFTGDGSISKTVVEATTKSSELADQLLYALARLGIVGRLSRKIVDGRVYYRITINGQVSLRRFAEHVRFVDSGREAKLKAVCNARMLAHTNTDTIPAGALMRLSLQKSESWRRIRRKWYTYWDTNKNIGRETLSSFVKDAKLQKEDAKRLLRLARSCIFWDEVREVRREACSDKYVYDLVVPGAENFVGGQGGGVFLHNTTALNAVLSLVPANYKIVTLEDSVTRNAEIFVKTAGETKRIGIGEYVDALTTGKNPLPSGHIVAEPKNDFVLTMRRDGTVGWERCTGAIKHMVEKEFVKVTTAFGREIEVTADHSLFGLDETGSMRPIGCGELKKGDYIAVPKRISIPGKRRSYLLSRLPDFKNFKIVTRNGERRISTKNGSTSIPERIALDPDLGFLAGTWLADGFYDDCSVGFSVGWKGLGRDVRKIVGRFGLGTKVHSDGVSILVHSTPFKTLLKKTLGLDGDDYTRRVPQTLMFSRDDVARALLRGYFSGDGNVSAGEVEASSSSRNLLLDIQMLLQRFGISMKITNERKVGYYGGIGTFTGRIAGRTNLAAFARLIGFVQQDKQSKINTSGKRPRWSLDPIPLAGPLREEVSAAIGHISKSRSSPKEDKCLVVLTSQAIKRGVIGRDVAIDLVKRWGGFRNSRLYKIAKSDARFDLVEKIMKRTAREYAYDLTVPGTQRFVANGVLCRNTPELFLQHPEWLEYITRSSMGTTGTFEVKMFDLVKTSLRVRPDIVVVGEVRGEEAQDLFQAVSSVTGDMPILTRQARENWFGTIGAFVDKFYANSPDGIPVPIAGSEVLTMDKNKRVIFAPIKYVLRHKADEVYRIRYSGGEARTTGAHSVFVIDSDGEVVPREVRHLIPGDFMVSFTNAETERERPTIDVEKILRSVYPSGLKEANGSLRRGSSKEIPKSIALDGLFARVLGIYMADGCVKHHRGSRVIFSLGKPEKGIFAKDLVSFFARYGSSPSIDDRGTYAIIEFNHTLLAKVFEAVCGRCLKEKWVPEFIWSSPRDLVEEFLDGWKADARRKGMEKSGFTYYSSARIELLHSLSWLARMNGHTSFMSERSSRYRVVAISNKNTKHINESIPAEAIRKIRSKLGSKWNSSYPDGQQQKITKERARAAMAGILSSKRTPMTNEIEADMKKINSLLSSSVIVARVISIDKERFDGYVYDLSVPDSEMFFGGETPTAYHNTGHGGLSSIHSDAPENAVMRLTNPPLNVPAAWISTISSMVLIRQVELVGGAKVRRTMGVYEFDGTTPVTIFKYDVMADDYEPSDPEDLVKMSARMREIAVIRGWSDERLIKELVSRAALVQDLAERGKGSFQDIVAAVDQYYDRSQ